MKIKMMTLTAITVCLLTAHAATSKDKPRDWQEGKLTSIERRQDLDLSIAHTLVTFSYTITVGDKFYVGDRGVTFTGHHLDAEINSTIKFALEGKRIYVLDADGKEWSLVLTKHGIKE